MASLSSGGRTTDGATDRPAFRVVDAHQHFWDPGRNYYPWLVDDLTCRPTTAPMPRRS